MLVCLTHLGAQETRATVCLNMIVKNERHVIERCLASVKPVIDYWVIVDTGSTDGTQESIKNFMKDIPGELHERPWVDFSHNRNEALELAKEKADYLLFMDADDWLEFDGEARFPPLIYERYNIWRVMRGESFANHQMVKASLPWKWVGPVHECLECGRVPSSFLLTNVKYVVGNDGASHHDPEKFQKYVRLLEKAMQEEPNNSRYLFSLAQSYRGAGEKEKALELYQKRILMGAWTEETFWSFIQLAHLQRELGYPVDFAINNYYLAHSFRPYRAEPVYFLAELFNSLGKYEAAYKCIKRWEQAPRPAIKDSFYNFDWTEKPGIPFQLSVCAYYVGKYQESLDACDMLLAMKDLPEHWRKQTEINRIFPLKHLLAESHL